MTAVTRAGFIGEEEDETIVLEPFPDEVPAEPSRPVPVPVREPVPA